MTTSLASSRGKWRTSWFGRRLNRTLGFFELVLMKIYRRKEDFNLLKSLALHEKEFNFKPSEVFMIYSLAKAKSGAGGEFAEVGVFRGLSAEVICRAKGEKPLWLFDTFEGLPDVGDKDSMFAKGTYCGSIDSVRNRLAPWKGVSLVKGLFPQSAEPIRDKIFSFVHLDVDLYESTKASLEFFYPRMEKGGVILTHDYGQAEGVKKAFNEFFAGTPESMIELPMSQCMVIKGL